MANRNLLFLFCFFLSLSSLWAQAPKSDLRSIDEIFPSLSESQKREISSENGIIHSLGKDESFQFIPAPGSGIDLYSEVIKINPSHLAESLLLIPYEGKKFTQLDTYNALGNVSDLKGRLYSSHTRNAEVPLFEDATRVISAENNKPLSDPPPSNKLPLAETVFMRLKDVNFGNSYYRAQFSVNSRGVTYHLTNYKPLSYLIFTVMKTEKFTAYLYMEPLVEGMLVYSVAGAETSDFVAKQVDMPSAIRKRLAVFIAWIKDGLKNS